MKFKRSRRSRNGGIWRAKGHRKRRLLEPGVLPPELHAVARVEVGGVKGVIEVKGGEVEAILLHGGVEEGKPRRRTQGQHNDFVPMY